MANVAAIYDAEIEAIVDLALNEKPIQLSHELIYCRFPLNDGGGNSTQVLRAAVDAVESFIDKQIPTLVGCSAGMSRSLAVTAAALARNRGQSFDDTLVELVVDLPHDVSPLLWSEVCKACGQQRESEKTDGD
jgi:protein-tyrosine phosphatase